MKRRLRGFTLTEMVIGVMLVGIVTLAAMSLLVTGLQQFGLSSAQTTLATDNAQGIRFMAKQLRQAMSVTITNGGRTITYVLPKLNTTADAVTGEKEFMSPPVGDGVVRQFNINPTNLRLIDLVTGQILARNVVLTDPDPASSQYNQTYAPFQLTSIGSGNAIMITLITQDAVGTQTKYVRFKSCVLLRNTQ